MILAYINAATPNDVETERLLGRVRHFDKDPARRPVGSVSLVASSRAYRTNLTKLRKHDSKVRSLPWVRLPAPFHEIDKTLFWGALAIVSGYGWALTASTSEITAIIHFEYFGSCDQGACSESASQSTIPKLYTSGFQRISRHASWFLMSGLFGKFQEPPKQASSKVVISADTDRSGVE